MNSTATMSTERRILLVDDNRAIHEDFRKILGNTVDGIEELESIESLLFRDIKEEKATQSFCLESAYQGEEALSLVRAACEEGRPYAMAFMDIRMPPGWDGIETTAKIWEIDPNMQVVLCTAYSDYSWDEVLERVGQSDRLVILKKPFDNVEVLQMANALTEKWRLLQESKKRIDGLEEETILKDKELHQTQVRFRLIAEHASDLISIVRDDCRCEYASPSFQHLLGYDPESIHGEALFTHIHEEDRQRIWEATAQTFQTQKGWRHEFRFQNKAGGWLTLEAHSSFFAENGSHPHQVVIYARDVTRRKEMEAEQQSMEVELRHAQKMESIGQLAAGIAHEINTPTQYIGDNIRFLKEGFEDLNALTSQFRNLIQNLEANTSPEATRQAVSDADKEMDWDYLVEEIPLAIDQSLDGVSQVARIVKAMKEFSHPGTEEMTQVDLNHAIESTVTVAKNEWKYVADMELELDPDLQPVSCSPGELNQAILNLITNAAHAIADTLDEGKEEKGTIRVVTRQKENAVCICISDTGPGIPEEIRQKVFEPFFTTKEVGKGTGQGLSIVHSVVVEKHGGQIELQSESGEGSTFTLTIPQQDEVRENSEEVA